MNLPIKTVYYQDPKNDEFSVSNITARVIDEHYQYLPPEPGWSVRRFIAYRLVAMPIAYAYCKLCLHSRFMGIEKLKKAEGGCFVYGNHNQQIGDPFIPNLALFPKSVYMIVHPDNVSMPVLGRFTPLLGALPLQSNLKAMKNFRQAIETRINQGHLVMIYPEAHIWPYYIGIRDFPATSMRYPVELDAPSFALTTTYQKRRFFKKPRAVTYIDGPFYPDKNLSPKAAAKKLRDQIYDAMVARSRESNCEYIRYIQKEEAQ